VGSHAPNTRVQTVLVVCPPRPGRVQHSLIARQPGGRKKLAAIGLRYDLLPYFTSPRSRLACGLTSPEIPAGRG